MNTNPLKESGLTEHSAGIGTLTRDMVYWGVYVQADGLLITGQNPPPPLERPR